MPSTKLDSKLVTYALPEKLPRSQSYYEKALTVALLLRSFSVAPFIYSALALIGYPTFETFGAFSYFSAAIVFLVVGLILRAYAIKPLRYFYGEVQQGVVIEQNMFRDNFTVTIQGNNRMNGESTQVHSVNAGDWFRSVNGTGKYNINDYVDFTEISTD